MACLLITKPAAPFFLIIGATIFLQCSVLARSSTTEEFHEELLLKPLPDRKVLAHFHFQSSAPPSKHNGRHHHLFPKAISRLVQKFHIKEMELSFTQGCWNYERWGGSDPMSSYNAKPPGVELWAIFGAPQNQVDYSWRNLTHALSGLFCASINFLEFPTMYSTPEWSFQSVSGNLRYGMLPREATCTENLTPWLKLLPCRDKAGFSALMDRPSIYNGFYHSLRLHVISDGSDPNGVNSGIVLRQALTVVLKPNHLRTNSSYSTGRNSQPNWSLSSLFGRKARGKCVLSKASTMYLQLERDLVATLKKNWTSSAESSVSSDVLVNNSGFQLSAQPDRVFEEETKQLGDDFSVLYEFSLEKYNDSHPFDLGFTWKCPVAWSCQRAPFHVSRFLMGSGTERGAIAILLKSTNFSCNSLLHDGHVFQVDLFQVVPWHIKVYYHTLDFFVDGQQMAVGDVAERIRVLPSNDKFSPGVLEMVLKFSCDVKFVALTLEFDKGFLHIDEYPPDANQGFDIPSAAINFPKFTASMVFRDNCSTKKSPIFSKFQERNPVMLYTEVLLVPSTTPDFTMPYNVITFTCTVLSLYFGSMLNVLRRRVGEEERFDKGGGERKHNWLTRLRAKLSAKLRIGEQLQSDSKSSSWVASKPAMRVVVVAILAIGWQYYFGR